MIIKRSVVGKLHFHEICSHPRLSIIKFLTLRIKISFFFAQCPIAHSSLQHSWSQNVNFSFGFCKGRFLEQCFTRWIALLSLHHVFFLATDEVHLSDHEDPLNITYAAADSYCRVHAFLANFSSIGLGNFIISPKIPVRFPYCSGSCDSPYSLGARDNSYVTYNVLIRQLANLDKVPLSEGQKKKFKTVCCVPVEYTSLQVVLVSHEGVRKKLWIDSIPTRCGCR